MTSFLGKEKRNRLVLCAQWGKPCAMKRGSLNPMEHIRPDGTLPVRASPGAAAERLVPGDPMRVAVTVQPEGGKANKAIIALLAKAFGLPKSAVVLLRGDTCRDKLFRIDHGG